MCARPRASLCLTDSPTMYYYFVATGEWPGWKEGDSMPNSEGCIHGWPTNIKKVAEILASLGVVAHKNTGGKTPYPFKPQGLLSVWQMDD